MVGSKTALEDAKALQHKHSKPADSKTTSYQNICGLGSRDGRGFYCSTYATDSGSTALFMKGVLADEPGSVRYMEWICSAHPIRCNKSV